jgi:hypothetical protein
LTKAGGNAGFLFWGFCFAGSRLTNSAVVLRESGGPSTLRLLDSIIDVSGILDRPVKPGDDD